MKSKLFLVESDDNLYDPNLERVAALLENMGYKVTEFPCGEKSEWCDIYTHGEEYL